MIEEFRLGCQDGKGPSRETHMSRGVSQDRKPHFALAYSEPAIRISTKG